MSGSVVLLNNNYLKNIGMTFFIIILSAVLLFAYIVFGYKIPLIIGISLVPLLFIMSLNYWLTFSLLLLSIFIKFDYAWYTTGVWFSFVFIFSYFLTHQKILKRDYKIPLTFPIIFYILSILPSYFVSIRPLFSIYLSYNLVAIISIAYILSSSFTNERIIYAAKLYFLYLIINGFQVIYQGITTGDRAFGLAGVMFVDYVGIGIVITVIFIIFNKNTFLRIVSGLLLFFLLISSLLTQTRNSWVAIALALFSLLLFLIKRAKFFNLNRKLLILTLIILISVISSGYLLVEKINPAVATRTEETTEFKNSISETGKVENTLVTRLFIWDTAFNMIQKKPILGIGAYSFPITSKYYYTIPKILYKKYVKGRTPHITFLAVLVETGIVGLIGFLFFIISVLRINFKTINLSSLRNDQMITLSLFWSLIYIFISMFMTDAWIWGQGAILFGIILGLNLANRRILLSNLVKEKPV